MNLLDVIPKATSRISGALFYVANINRIRFSSPPVIWGRWPIVNGSGKISIGRKCVFHSFRVRHCITSGANAYLRIGDGAYINDGANICAMKEVVIGNSVKIGDMVCIFDTDFHPVSPEAPVKQQPVSIADNVWIAANAMVLAGSRIGDHSVIAAGSIVTGEIPPRTVAAGSPARAVKTFEAPDGWIRG